MGTFHFIRYLFYVIFATLPVITSNFSFPDTILQHIPNFYVYLWLSTPLFTCCACFLMYPLNSRHLYMLIITKADLLKYSYSRVNIHKPLWDY